MIKDMFSLMDEDNDGRITYLELKAGLQKVGSQLGEPEIKMLMEVVTFHITTPSLIKDQNSVLRLNLYGFERRLMLMGMGFWTTESL